MTFSVTGTTVSGNGSMNGIQCLDTTTCDLLGYYPSTGSLSGTVSGNTISVTYTGTVNGCNNGPWNGTFSGTLSGSTITGDLYLQGVYASRITLTRQ